MDKHCLFIDDDNDFTSVIERIVDAGKHRKLKITYDFLNPTSDDLLNSNDDIDGDKLKTKLEAKIENSKFDLVACDYNFGDENIFGIDILKTLRQKDRKFIGVIYSANLNSIVKDIFKAYKPSEPEITLKKVQGLVTTNISRFFTKNKNLMEDVAPLLLTSPVEKQIEGELLKHGGLKFSHGFPDFHGLTLAQIANEIKLDTPRGNKFIEELVHRGIAHAVDLNS